MLFYIGLFVLGMMISASIFIIIKPNQIRNNTRKSTLDRAMIKALKENPTYQTYCNAPKVIILKDKER
jgi:hypothetical protein